MRAVTLLLSPPPNCPTFRLFDEGARLRPERVHNLNLLEDGTLVLLGRVRGDLGNAREFLEAQADVLGFSVSGGDGPGARGLVFVHSRPPPAVRRFLALPREREVFFDLPIAGTREGRPRVVVVGETDADLQRERAAVPSELDVEIERIGPDAEDPGAVAPLLTDRQREVLDVALDLGYYEGPRGTTHRDIAERLGVSVGTVSGHLQKIEARVFDALGTWPRRGIEREQTTLGSPRAAASGASPEGHCPNQNYHGTLRRRGRYQVIP